MHAACVRAPIPSSAAPRGNDRIPEDAELVLGLVARRPVALREWVGLGLRPLCFALLTSRLLPERYFGAHCTIDHYVLWGATNIKIRRVQLVRAAPGASRRAERLALRIRPNLARYLAA